MARRDGAAILTLNDPPRRNILSGALCRDLIRAVEDANADPGVTMIILTGAGPAFCAGADLGDLQDAAKGDDTAVRTVYRSFMAVADSPLPTLAAVNGPAVGAGFNLALACDMRIACPAARFDTRFLQIGLHPGGGHAWMLLRAVGWAQASRMLLAGAETGCEDALAIGLIQEAVPADALIDHAMKMTGHLRATPRELLLRTKASLRLAARASHAESFAHETAEQAWSLGQPAFADLIARLQGRIGGKA